MRNAARACRPGCTVSTVASRTRIATAMSLGWVAMHASLAPTMACWRLKPPMAEQPLPGRACCTAGRCRRSTGSACAAAGCRRSSPCCATGPRRRPAARATARRSRGARARSAARSVLRTSAPIAQSAVLGCRRSCRGPGRSRRPGGSASRSRSFIRSSRLVPPAMNFAPGVARHGRGRFGGRARAFVAEGLHASLPPLRRWHPRCSSRRRSGRCCRSCARAPPRPSAAGARVRSAVTWLGMPCLDLVEHARRPSRSGPACSSRTGSRRA